jgi:hypothetical protein
MAKIVKVEEIKSTWQGKDKTSYKFHLDDGKEGFAANKAPWEFKEGENVSYTTEVKKSSKGEYNLFTFTRLEKSAPDNTASSGPPLKPQSSATTIPVKANATIQAMRFCIDAFIADKITWDKIKEYHKEITGYLNDAIDECSS